MENDKIPYLSISGSGNMIAIVEFCNMSVSSFSALLISEISQIWYHHPRTLFGQWNVWQTFSLCRWTLPAAGISQLLRRWSKYRLETAYKHLDTLNNQMLLISLRYRLYLHQMSFVSTLMFALLCIQMWFRYLAVTELQYLKPLKFVKCASILKVVILIDAQYDVLREHDLILI